MRNNKYCYYHQGGRPTAVKLTGHGKRARFTLPILKDAQSVQFFLAQVIHQLMDKNIDAKTARCMLYSLQIASTNFEKLKGETPKPCEVLRDLSREPKRGRSGLQPKPLSSVPLWLRGGF